VASAVATGAVVNTDVLPRQRAKLANLQGRDRAAGTGSVPAAIAIARRSILREIICMEFPGSIPTTAIATRHRTNRMQAGA
jgi:hypothetical protein